MRREHVLASVMLPIVGTLVRAQDDGAGKLLAPELGALFHEELSGEVAKDHVLAITRHHRIQGSRGYRAAAQWVLAKLREYGFDERHARIESFPSDGKIHYQTWQSPSGWDISSAELRLMEPCDDPAGERIVGYPEIAMSVVTYSNPGDVTAELVWVGEGTSEPDYAGKEVKGKFVLATGYGGAVHRLAVLAHGAAAVVCYLDDERAAEHPDMLQYTGMWPRPDELERTTFGFNLTNRQGERLRARLVSGEKVVLRGRVEGIGLEPFAMDVVVATIEGSERPEEELVFSAHLDHPKESANDNASGSGATLDIARALQKLIAEGRLPRPKRTLRFLWVPEWHGTMAYLDAHPEVLGPTSQRGGTVLANMNMDMVGENLELLHSKLVVTKNPFSVPTCLDDVVADVLRFVDGLDVRTPRGSLSAFHHRQTPYSGGSDHMMFLDRGIPSVMLSHDPDYTHHTSEDTPDKVDPVELERCEILATGTLWLLANLTEREAVDVAWLAAAGAERRVDDAARRLREQLAAVEPVALSAATSATTSELRAAALATLRVVGRREDEAIESVLRHYDLRDDAASPLVARVTTDLRAGLREHVESRARALRAEFGVAESELAQRDPAGSSDRRRVVRKTRGPLAFGMQELALQGERAAWYSSPSFPFDGDERFELVNLANTGASLSEIRAELGAEFEPVPLADVVRFFEDLAALDLVELAPGE